MVMYRAFLIRIWSPTQGGALRASLTDVDSGAVHAFEDLGVLHDWLTSEIDVRRPTTRSPQHHNADDNPPKQRD